MTEYSDEFLTHAYTPVNLGLMNNPDGHGAPKGVCGDMIEIGLRVNGDVIQQAMFWTDGCVHTVACADVTTALAQGKSPAEALDISPEDVIEALKGLPPEHVHCARLAVTSLRLAIKDYLRHKNAPWKRAYEKH